VHPSPPPAPPAARETPPRRRSLGVPGRDARSANARVADVRRVKEFHLTRRPCAPNS
jgi:hypothetical protein